MIIISPYNQYLRGLDSDAATYIAAVESADGQALESTTKKAINDFIVGCKDDGIWDAIKASCILAGARTLDGALTPLVGAAPTNYNFVAGDYDRKAGLKGDRSTKYLNSNRAGDADPQGDFHASVFVSSAQSGTSGRAMMGAVQANPLVRVIQIAIDNRRDVCAVRSSDTLSSNRSLDSFATGFIGGSRGDSSQYNFRFTGTELTKVENSLNPVGLDIYIFAQNLGGSLSAPTDARLSFYSIGEYLNLALLDVRLTQLMTDINNAF